MLGLSAGLTGDGAPAAEEGQGIGGSSDVGGPSSINPGGGALDESERSGGGGGNRWPRQETLALLKIRSDMDAVFRDASVKGPLWEDVSRKMAELGFRRAAKKCKEKFENVYKYHKRTKDGRASDGKSYRFFDQLEAFESNTPALPRRSPPLLAAPQRTSPNLHTPPNIAAASPASPTPLTIIPQIPNNPSSLQPKTTAAVPASSSTSSDEGVKWKCRRRGGGDGPKRKWKSYFEGLLGEVARKQEEMQNRFLEALERRERDRVARDEAWRAQEAARMVRQREILARERSATAANDKAMLVLLQKAAREHNLQIPIITGNHNTPPPEAQIPQPPPISTHPEAAQTEMNMSETMDLPGNSGIAGGGDTALIQASSSRWPKEEVLELIKLRTGLDLKYQDNGPKGPLWEEISAAMVKIGYNRNAKRCKEKWENINKYYKKVKESNKCRPEDTKTCPYFHQLEEIYKEKAVTHGGGVNKYAPNSVSEMPPIMARLEQQWPLSHQQHPAGSLGMHGNDSGHIHELDDGDDEEDEGGVYEMMSSQQPQKQQ